MLVQADFDHAMDRVIAGLQQRRVITPKEKRILAYHEGGHALDVAPDERRSRRCRRRRSSPAARRSATRSTCPRRSATSTRRRSSIDWMVVTLAGRAAEQVVFGRVTNGAANDLEKVTELARAMVFEYGMGDGARRAHDARRQLRALRGDEAAARPASRPGSPSCAYAEALRLVAKHRALLDRVAAGAAREGDARPRGAARALRRRRAPSRSAGEAVGVPQIVAADPGPQYF